MLVKSIIDFFRSQFCILYSRRKVYDYEQIVVTPVHPGIETSPAQLNEENEDFSGRRRYHQTATVTGQYVNVD